MTKLKVLLGVIPLITMIIGTVVGTLLNLSNKLRAALLAVTAGLVASSIMTDVSPVFCNIEGETSLQKNAIIGILIGSIIMVALQSLNSLQSKCEDTDEKCKKTFKFPIVLTAALAADVFIDGLVIGQSFTDDKPALGFIIAMALEGFITTSSLANIIKHRNGKIQDILIANGVMIGASVLGLFLGWRFNKYFLDINGKPNPLKVKMYGAAFIVLIWTVVIELIPEALSESDKLWVYALWLISTGGGIGLDWVIG
jgi:zinc transporter ZupT